MRSNHINEDELILLALEGVDWRNLFVRAEGPLPVVRLYRYLDLVRY